MPLLTTQESSSSSANPPARRPPKNSKEPGVRGIARVCKEGYPDYNAWDSKHPYVRTGERILSCSRGHKLLYFDPGRVCPRCRYYDPKSKQENPTWYMVDVEVSFDLISIEYGRRTMPVFVN